MTWTKMSEVPNPVTDANGNPYSGAVLKAYLPGTTTATSIAIDKDGSSPQASLTANAEGIWEVSGNEVIPHIDRKCKWGIFANATDATANTPFYMGPFDNIDRSISISSTEIVFETVAAMVASTTLSIGDHVRTLGYTAIGDGGGNEYDIVAAATGTDDGGSYIDLATHQAKGLFPGGVHNVKQFGAVGDGVTDDTSAIQACLNYVLANNYASRFPSGVYLSDPLSATLSRSSLTDYRNIEIVGENYSNTTIIAKTAAQAHLLKLDGAIAPLDVGLTISNISFFGDSKAVDGLIINNIASFKLDKVRTRGFTTTGIELNGSLIGLLNECDVSNSPYGVKTNKLNSIYANALRIRGGRYTECSTYAIDFDYGLLLSIDGADFESNGTLSDTATGSINLGANTAEEISATALAVTISNSWFEGNKGYVINQQSGILTLSNVLGINTSADKDLHVVAGEIALDNCRYPAAGSVIDVSNATYSTLYNVLAVTITEASNTTSFHSNNGYRRGYTADLEVANDHDIRLTSSNGSNVNTIGINGVNGGFEFANATASAEHRFNNTIRINNHAWNGNLLRLENYYLWVDATGDLRIKSGAPASDTDGTIVGTQS